MRAALHTSGALAQAAHRRSCCGTEGRRPSLLTDGQEPSACPKLAGTAGYGPNLVSTAHGRLPALDNYTAGQQHLPVHGRLAARARPAGGPSTLAVSPKKKLNILSFALASETRDRTHPYTGEMGLRLALACPVCTG